MDCSNQFTWWQSVIIGAAGGFILWVLGILRELYLRYRDEKRILKYLKDESFINEVTSSPHTSLNIANNVNLTKERVNYICFISKHIFNTGQPKKVWVATSLKKSFPN